MQNGKQKRKKATQNKVMKKQGWSLFHERNVLTAQEDAHEGNEAINLVINPYLRVVLINR